MHIWFPAGLKHIEIHKVIEWNELKGKLLFIFLREFSDSVSSHRLETKIYINQS